MHAAPPAPEGWDYWFTVFTPAYNRAHFMRRIFESLERQTFKDFEWVIVDDGSGPQVKEAIDPLIAEASFPIRYIWQKNQGLHGSTNTGFLEARGFLFTSCDDDDWYHDQALERCLTHWLAIPEDQRERYTGVVGLCVDPNGDVIGNRFPTPVLDSDSFEIRVKYDIVGDKCGLQRSSILKEHLFPMDLGKHVPLSIVWNRIAANYRQIFFDEVIQIKDFQPEGGTARLPLTRARSPKPNALYHLEFVGMNQPIPFKHKFRNYANYVRYALHDGRSLAMQAAEAPQFLHWALSLPMGWWLYRKDLRLLAADDAERAAAKPKDAPKSDAERNDAKQNDD